MADWRKLLTHQEPPAPVIPHSYKTVAEYVARFEDLNRLKRTSELDYRKKGGRDADETLL